MRIFAIADLHLATAPNIEKPMDIFGAGWVNHAERLRDNWIQTVADDDYVMVPGDISWGLKLEEAIPDLDWIDALPGKKIILKGNHDLWWASTNKLNKLYEGRSLTFMKHSAYMIGDLAICGARGWTCPGTDGFSEHDRKVYDREVLRLKMSLEEAKKSGASQIIAMLHFPPTNDKQQGSDFTKTMSEYGVRLCMYGHLHGKNVFPHGLKGVYNGVEYRLCSLDYVDAMPQLIYDDGKII